MQLYMIDMSENNFILALSSCPVKDTSCVATDGNNIVNSTAAADRELDCGSTYLVSATISDKFIQPKQSLKQTLQLRMR